jgi:hypothetical protein
MLIKVTELLGFAIFMTFFSHHVDSSHKAQVGAIAY